MLVLLVWKLGILLRSRILHVSSSCREGGTMVTYGGMAKKPITLSTASLIFKVLFTGSSIHCCWGTCNSHVSLQFGVTNLLVSSSNAILAKPIDVCCTIEEDTDLVSVYVNHRICNWRDFGSKSGSTIMQEKTFSQCQKNYWISFGIKNSNTRMFTSYLIVATSEYSFWDVLLLWCPDSGMCLITGLIDVFRMGRSHSRH